MYPVVRDIAKRLLYPIDPRFRGVELMEGIDWWMKSRKAGVPIDSDGAPWPWWTYSSIRFLEPRLGSSFRVFEWGSGYSTRWLAARVKEIVAVEHDPDWYEELDDAEVLFRPGGDGYVSAIRGRGPFEVVIVDGQERVACAHEVTAELADDGVVIWDNADRPDYQMGYDHLTEQGFRRIDFTGIGPVNGYVWTTAVFYRPGNCLGI